MFSKAGIEKSRFFYAETQRGGAATKASLIRKPGNQDFFPVVLGFLASL
jgi:hypothetical protein